MKAGDVYLHSVQGLVVIVDGNEIEPGVVLARLENGTEPGVSISMLKPVTDEQSDGGNTGAGGGDSAGM